MTKVSALPRKNLTMAPEIAELMQRFTDSGIAAWRVMDVLIRAGLDVLDNDGDAFPAGWMDPYFEAAGLSDPEKAVVKGVVAGLAKEASDG